jgi:hypothetical protein
VVAVHAAKIKIENPKKMRGRYLLNIWCTFRIKCKVFPAMRHILPALSYDTAEASGEANALGRSQHCNILPEKISSSIFRFCPASSLEFAPLLS